MNLVVEAIFVHGAKRYQQPRKEENKGRCAARVITNQGVVNMRLEDLPHLTTSPNILRHGIHFFTPSRISSKAADFITNLTANGRKPARKRLSQDREKYDLNRLIPNLRLPREDWDCFEFATALLYHFYRGPILDKTNFPSYQLLIKDLSAQVCMAAINNGIQLPRKYLNNVPHLSFVMLKENLEDPLFGHYAVVVEENGRKYVWEKDVLKPQPEKHAVEEWTSYQEAFPLVYILPLEAFGQLFTINM